MVHVPEEGFRPLFRADAEPGIPLSVCPGFGVTASASECSAPERHEEEIGHYCELWQGHAVGERIRFSASSGGLLTALGSFCLERLGSEGAIHTVQDSKTPWLSRTTVSRSTSDLLAGCGSRYAPSAPVTGICDIRDERGSFVFVGKPCDTAALSALCREDPEVHSKIGLILTFFCAGTPSTKGTLHLIQSLEIPLDEVTGVRYRGEGWPGHFRVTFDGGTKQKTLSYRESWARLTQYRPLRCHLCPDGLGRAADISCGDAWQVHSEGTSDPGQSLIIVRTERGRRVFREAMENGFIVAEPIPPEALITAQKSLLRRREELYGRLLAFRALGLPIPKYAGFALARSWGRLGFHDKARSVLGTLRRIVRYGWYRRRSAH
jgi:coenzyme F420 hydrogenase subunit beta